MKNYTLIAFILGLMFTFSSTAQAQKFQQIIAEIPFEFTLNDKKFDAGKYVIATLSPNAESGMLQLYSRDGKSQTIFMGIPNSYKNHQGKDEVTLLFTRYANQYFLSGILKPSEFLKMEVVKSKTEVQVARQFKNRKSETASVVLTPGKN